MILNRKTLTGSTLAVLSVLFISVVMLSNNLMRGLRLDLTENALYTLSTGTRHLLGSLEEPLHLTLYFSDKATAESTRPEIGNLRIYFERVRELLEEMNSVSNGKIQLEVVDPIAYSEAEDRAAAAGLQGIPVGPSGEKIFFGLAGSNSTTGQAFIPFFDPGKESFLEYDISKFIHDLSISKKPGIAILSSLPFGSGFDQKTGQMNQGTAVYQQLSQLFEIKNLNYNNFTGIPAEINTLVLVHPKQFNDNILYAIDQFVLRGGHLLVFVDPNAEMDLSGTDSNNPVASMLANKASDLPELFKAWGIEYARDQIVLDRAHAVEITLTANAKPVRHPGILHLTRVDMPHDDIITANLERINLSSVGYFKQSKDSPYQMSPLLKSSNQAMTTQPERFNVTADPSTLLDNFKPSGEEYVLAARLQGKFKTAFPQRNDAGHLTEAKENGEILLVADTDLLTDRLWVQIQDFFGKKIMNNFADNANFFINAVDNFSGSNDLISIRGRGTSSRPFLRVEALKMVADERFRIKEQELQQELSVTEQKLVELQRAKSGDQKQVLSDAQAQELEHFLQRKLEIRKELREVRRQLDAEIDALGAWLKFINIALLPILLTLGTLFYLGWQNRHKPA